MTEDILQEKAHANELKEDIPDNAEDQETLRETPSPIETEIEGKPLHSGRKNESFLNGIKMKISGGPKKGEWCF